MHTKRLLNFIIDTILIDFTSLIIMGILSDKFNLGYFKNILIVYSIILMTYYVVCEYFWNQTLGKKMTKTKIVFTEQKPQKLKSVLIRTISRFIPFEPISGIFNDDCEMWHDKISKIKVVKLDNK